MVEPIVVAVAQPLSIPHDVAGNAGRHGAAVRAAGARVVVFPELSLTGYEFDAAPIDPSDPRLGPIVDACGATGSVTLAGAPVAGTPGNTGIGMLAVNGDGAAVVYRKMWLGDAEAGTFVPGGEPAVLDVDGWRLGLAICKDTGVPQHARDTAALGIDVYVAGVLELDADREAQPSRARRVARDLGVWVAIASFAGSTGGGFERTAGRSGIWRPDGSVAARAGPEAGEIAVAVIARE